jgi:serine-type D-Ala-D-Ala carboxypeptidase/endopeptidase
LRGQFQHLGWFEANGLIWHSGGTPGYRSFMGFDPKRRIGVVVLSNAATDSGVDDIGMHVLNPKWPLLGSKDLQPPKARRETSVQVDVLERYVGRYDFSTNDWITVTRVGDQLFIGGSGYPNVRFYPESDVAFFSKSFNEQIIFSVDGAGRATEALDIGSGESKRYKRVR